MFSKLLSHDKALFLKTFEPTGFCESITRAKHRVVFGFGGFFKKNPTILGLSCSITNTAISNHHFSKVLLTGHYLSITLVNLKNLFIPLESFRAHRLRGSQWYKNHSQSSREFMVTQNIFSISSRGFRVFIKDIQYEEQLGETMHKLCCNHRTAKT